MTFLAVADLEFSKDQVAIAVTHGLFGSHAGIAYHSVKDGLQLLHLAWHQRLVVDSYPLAYCWIACKPEVPPLASKQLVGIVRAIAKRKPSVNYAVDAIAAKGSFDANGHYRPPKGSKGLTCATFVTEIFRAALLPLIKEETWAAKDVNVKWANDVADRLQRDADEVHVAAVRASINGIRVRPEEVGAAGTVPFKQRPVLYDVAFDAAPKVMTHLHQVCPITPVAIEAPIMLTVSDSTTQNNPLPKN
ncbi:MAG: hypothetical protein V4447_00210 [Pseudomonadota bacterium]